MLIKRKKRNQKGMAVLEIIPVMIVAVVLLNYTLGLFGVIHSGILNSISARNYSFEIFRNRSDLSWFRDDKSTSNPDENRDYLYPYQVRIQGTISETELSRTNGDPDWIATTRPLAFVSSLENSDPNRLGQQGDRKSLDSYFAKGGSRGDNMPTAYPVWIRTSYGMCLNAKCGEN